MAITGRMRPVEVVLIDLPEVLSDIVTAILERDADVRIAAQLRSEGSSFDPAVTGAFDVAIVGGDGEALAGAVRDLLCSRPRLRALTVGGDGREAFLYELRPHRTPLGEVSPDTLLGAVKAVGELGCASARSV
jgi:hypothetical protein